jgi:hypothetical protein
MLPGDRLDEHLKSAATTFVELAFAEAEKQGIVPRHDRDGRRGRFEGPWPSTYPCIDISGSELAADFVATLLIAYPDRFGVESKFPYKDPTRFVAALLRATIAEVVIREQEHSALRGALPEVVGAFDPATAIERVLPHLLEELDCVASLDGQRFACLWAVSDIDLTAVHGHQVGETRLLRPHHFRDLTVSELIPEALWVSDDGMPGDKYQGVLFAVGDGPGDHWDVTKRLNDSMGRFLTTLRLATATTLRERMVWLGEPSLIHIELPEAHAQTSEPIFGGNWRRVAALMPADLPGLRELGTLVDRLEPTEPTKPMRAVVVAMRRYSRSFRDTAWQDTVLDLATALEACLVPPRDEIGLTLRTRAAHLLAHDDSQQAGEIYDDIEDLYTLRSEIIHGKPKFTKDLAKLWSDRGYTHVLQEESMEVLLDRWREIVRRAIAARLMLGDDRLGPPLWPFAKDVKVDRFLVRKDSRGAWRDRIVAGAEAYGLPLLASQAPRLVDLHEPVNA